MCNPLWLISHQHCLNHTSVCTLSDRPQDQESIKHYPFPDTRQFIHLFLFLPPWWKLKINSTLPIKIHHSVPCEQGHGAVSEGEGFPPVGTQVVLRCQITPHTYNSAEHWSPPQVLDGLCPIKVTPHISCLQVRLWTQGLWLEVRGAWQPVQALVEESRYTGLLLLTLNSKISWSLSKY